MRQEVIDFVEHGPLEPERIGIRHARFSVLRPQWNDGRGLIKPDKGVELLWQRSIRVVAQELGFGSVDDTDESFQTRLEEASSKSVIPPLPEVEQEPR